MIRSWMWTVPLGMLLALAACGDDDPVMLSPGGSTSPGDSTQTLSCTPNTPRACPCVYGGDMGTQLCLPGGAGYGPCQGCPTAPAQPGPDAAAGDSGSTSTDASTATDAAMEAAVSNEAAVDGSADASGSGGDGSTGEGPAQIPGAEGTSCGVGLPTLCALETEKCCVRTLMTDTCIGASEACDCPLNGCDVLEAHCDGPEDCADGQVCCGTLAGSSYSEFRCADSCDGRGSQRIACHQGETECPSGDECSNSQLLTNLQVCIDPSTIAQ